MLFNRKPRRHPWWQSCRQYPAVAVSFSLFISLAAAQPGGAVEIFTSPEAKQQWEARQAAERKAKKDTERAKVINQQADKDASKAGMKRVPTALSKSKPPAASTKTQNSGSGTNSDSDGDSASSGQLPKFNAPLAPAIPIDADKSSKKSPPGASETKGKGESNTAQRRARGGPPTLTWINPDVEPKAALLCVHGLGLHNQSYEDFGKRMAAAGIATYAVDVRGFGSWQNASGRRDVDFNDCLLDVRDTLKVMHRVHPGLPVFILGESMGGAIALRATAMYPELVDGLISCVPSGDRFKQHKTELRVAFRFLQGANKKFDVGHEVIKQATESRSGDGSANEKQKEDWLRDPLNRLNLSPNELIQFQRFMNENHDTAKLIKDRPVLMVQGADDNLVKATGTLELLSNIPVSNKDVYLVVIRDAKHLIFEESQSNDQAFNEKVLRLVNGWIDDHIKRPTVSQAPTTP